MAGGDRLASWLKTTPATALVGGEESGTPHPRGCPEKLLTRGSLHEHLAQFWATRKGAFSGEGRSGDIGPGNLKEGT